MRVRFSYAEEFLDELAQDAHLVEDGILRVTQHHQPLRMKPLMLLSVRAGVMINGKIIELHQPIGHIWQPPAGGQDDAKVRQRAQEVCTQVEAKASALGLTIRRGMFQS
jgi:cell division FtsZ-interacting protein ZapD